MATHAERRRRYALWLDAQQLEFGFAAELALLSDRRTNGVMNDTPPEGLWPAIVPTVRLVERVRAQFGPTTIHSAYRSPAYNAAVTTSTDSRHSHNDAIDFSCLQGTPSGPTTHKQAAEWFRQLAESVRASIGLERLLNVHIYSWPVCGVVSRTTNEQRISLR